MNKNQGVSYHLSMLVIFVLFSFAGCLKDKSHEACELTKLPQSLHFNVQPKLRVLENSLPDQQELKKALEIQFTGSVRKYYCSGDHSEPFIYNSSFDPWAIDQAYWTGGFLVGKAYGFNIDNEEDYIYSSVKLAASFFDGFTYTAQINTLTYKDDIFKDIDNLKDFFFIDVTSETVWVQVK
jgi:hypothetical protein